MCECVCVNVCVCVCAERPRGDLDALLYLRKGVYKESICSF